MSEMVDKLARIICEHERAGECHWPECPCEEAEWVGCKIAAGEILLAMRSPTEAMTDAGRLGYCREVPDMACPAIKQQPISCRVDSAWTAMIDSAIAPPSPSDAPG